MEAVKNYLTTIKQKNWSDLTSKNSSAWIMAVQIALEERGIDVGKDEEALVLGQGLL